MEHFGTTVPAKKLRVSAKAEDDVLGRNASAPKIRFDSEVAGSMHEMVGSLNEVAGSLNEVAGSLNEVKVR